MEPRDENQRSYDRQQYVNYRSNNGDNDLRGRMSGLNSAEQSAQPQPPSPGQSVPSPVPQTEAFTPPTWQDAPEKTVATNTEAQAQPSAPNLNQPFVQKTFEPPAKPAKKKLRDKLPKFRLSSKQKTIIVMIFGAGLALALFWMFISWQAGKSDPATVLRDGVSNNLGLKSVQVDKTDDSLSSTTYFDFTNAKDAVVSGDVQLKSFDSIFTLSTYGSSQSTYVKYTALPSSIDAKTVQTIKDKWVQLRSSGKTSDDTSHELLGISDSRSLLFGPVIYGNISDEKSKNQLTDFIVAHKIYKLTSTKVAKSKVDGKSVYVLPVALDSGYLKVAIQTAALGYGYAPQDIADAVRSIDDYKSAKGDLYVTKRGHRIVRFVITKQDGSKATFKYSNFDKTKTSGMPSGAISWQAFSSSEWKLKALAAAKQLPASVDSERIASLTKLQNMLSSFKAQNGYYPSIKAINDLSWMSKVTNKAPELQRDPVGGGPVMVSAPKYGYYAYQVSSASGGACDNVKIACGHYVLSSILSNKKVYSVQSR